MNEAASKSEDDVLVPARSDSCTHTLQFQQKDWRIEILLENNITTSLHKKQFYVQWKINFEFILLFGSSNSNNTDETYINFSSIFCSSSASMHITQIIILRHTHIKPNEWVLPCVFVYTRFVCTLVKKIENLKPSLLIVLPHSQL